MQRAYIPISAVGLLHEVTTQLSIGSQVLIIDEFRDDNTIDGTYHLGTPCNLLSYTRYCADLEAFYQSAGESLLYYPPYRTCLTDILQKLGFSSVKQEHEKHMIEVLLGKAKTPLAKAYTYALLTSPKQKDPRKKSFSLRFPYATIQDYAS